MNKDKPIGNKETGNKDHGGKSPGEKNHQPETNFELAFQRLEEILERMNSGTVTLDESLKLYEEADSLVNLCSKRLNDAERKIETLIKNREGELALNQEQDPLTQDFSPPSQTGSSPT